MNDITPSTPPAAHAPPSVAGGVSFTTPGAHHGATPREGEDARQRVKSSNLATLAGRGDPLCRETPEVGASLPCAPPGARGNSPTAEEIRTAMAIVERYLPRPYRRLYRATYKEQRFAVALYYGGMGLRMVAEAMGRQLITVRRWIVAAGIDVTATGKARRCALTYEDRPADVYRMRVVERKPWATICRKLGVSQTMRKHLLDDMRAYAEANGLTIPSGVIRGCYRLPR